VSKCVPQKYQTPRIHRDKQQNLKRSLLLDSLGLNWNDDKETKNREREREKERERERRNSGGPHSTGEYLFLFSTK